MDKPTPPIGIDLGTTYSCMAYIDEAERPVVIKNFEGENTTPSVVAYEDGETVVGKVAKESAAANPHGVVSFVKRFMGQKYRFELESGTYSPEEISAAILRKLAVDAAQALGKPIKDVVITVPAYFGIEEREATKKAGEIAELNVLGIVPEPIAAAYAYGETEKEKNILVYDLGGGTFDVTVIKFRPGSYKTIVVAGDHNLGGKDWDDRIIRHLIARFAEQTSTAAAELEDDPQTMADLQDIAERVVKKTLTARDSAKTVVSHGGLREPVTVTRQEFGQLTADLVQRTVELTKHALAEAAKKGVREIDEVLLVGGSTKMPQIAEAVRREFGKEPRFHDPDEAVAKGAAIVARNEALLRRIEAEVGELPENEEELSANAREKLEKIAEQVGTDVMGLIGSVSKTYETVCSKSFGIVSHEMPARIEKVFNLILNNTELPATREKTFYTIDKAQTSVMIRIMENVVAEEKAEVAESKEVGQGVLDFNRAMPEATPIQVKFTMRTDGTLAMEASEATSGRKLEVTLENPNVIQGEELAKAKERSSAIRF